MIYRAGPTTYVRAGEDHERLALVLPPIRPSRRASAPLSRYDRLDAAPQPQPEPSPGPAQGGPRARIDGMERLRDALDLLGSDADFVIAPDIVAGGRASLDLSLSWLDRLDDARMVLIPNQDGLEPEDFEGIVSPRVGIFHGGSTEWKVDQMVRWGRWCAARDVYFHVGRVNTGPRFRLAHVAGANSVDGSSASRFAVNIPMLDGLARQGDLFNARAMS